MWTLVLSTFRHVCESWILTARLKRRSQALGMRCYRGPCDEHGGMQQNAVGVHGDLLTIVTKRTETQIEWPHFKILWHGEDNAEGDSERSKKARKIEEMGR